MNYSAMDDKETSNRRARLRELIATCFDNKDENLLSFIEQRTGKRPNQGELSAIQKPDAKSFGDRKAKNLTEQIGLHRRWFDFPAGTNIIRAQWMDNYIPDDEIKSMLPRPMKHGSLAEEAAEIIDSMPIDEQIAHLHYLRIAKEKLGTK